MGQSVTPSLRRNYYWTVVGNVAYAACQWGMLAIIAKTCTAEVVGQFALALAISGPIILLATLNLRAVQATDTHREFEFGDYLGLRIAGLLLASAVIVGICVMAGYRMGVVLVVVMMTLSKAFDALSDVFYGLAQQRERMDRIAASRTLQGVLQCAALGILVATTGRLVWGTLSMAVASGLVTMLYDVPRGVVLLGEGAAASNTRSHPLGRCRPRWSPKVQSRLVRMSLPLGISTSLWVLNANIPRYYIAYYLNPHDLGIFAALSYIMVVAANFITGSLIQAATPRLAAKYYREPVEFERMLWKLVGLSLANGITGVVVSALWGRRILSLLYSPEYAHNPGIFVWLMTGTAIYVIAIAFECGLMAMRQFDVQLIISLSVVSVTTTSCGFLVPRYGLPGAAWATMLGLSVKLLGNGVLLMRALPSRGRLVVGHRIGPLSAFWRAAP